jgi:hypothetical protein
VGVKNCLPAGESPVENVHVGSSTVLESDACTGMFAVEGSESHISDTVFPMGSESYISDAVKNQTKYAI